MPVHMKKLSAFILLHILACGYGLAEPSAPSSGVCYQVGHGLGNCRTVFETTRQGRVAYVGGSITASPGWRDMTYDILKKRFPDATFDFINAGVGGTNSSYGAFRLSEDALTKGRVDLLFLEFAVNDEGNTSPDNRRLRAMEGIIRQAKRHNPQIDIIMLYFADTEKLEKFRIGETPTVITDHESIAQHYNIPRLNLAREITRRLDAGQFTWSEFSRDTCHPNERGHAVYAECIQQMLDVAWKGDRGPLKPTPMPDALDPMNYERGRFIALDQANLVKDWKRIPAWDTEKKCNYGGAVDVLAAETPGAVLELAFEGTLIGISAIAGMDAGAMDVSIDDGKPSRMEMFDSYCLQFHRPVCHILAEDLPAGKHTLRLSIAPESKPESTGHAIRILKFVGN